MKSVDYDALIIGGGHAGIEAMRALAQRNFRVGLITLDPSKNGAMSCNPAIGGVAKSHLVFEIDAMGGLMGRAADESAIQSRRLNLTKGPAVRSTRVQCDKSYYVKAIAKLLSVYPNIDVVKGEGAELLFEKDSKTIAGVKLRDGSALSSRVVIITAGTFMNGLMFCGEKTSVGGRVGDKAAEKLSLALISLGHNLKRLKTGTPARLDARTINFSKLEKQWGDPEIRKFSWKKNSFQLPQLACFLTYTNEKTHEIIRHNFEKSPLFSGGIEGVGPRYCPSIEDKVKRFPIVHVIKYLLNLKGSILNQFTPTA